MQLNPLQKFEEIFLEPLINKCLELARKHIEQNLLDKGYFMSYKNFDVGCCAPSYELSPDVVIPNFPLGNCTNSVTPQVKPCGGLFKKPVCNQEKETTMRSCYPQAAVVTANVQALAQPSTDEKQRDYALNRLGEVRYELRDGLEKQFGLVDDDAPHTVKDLITRLTTGKFILRNGVKDTDEQTFWSVVETFRWRDPAKVEDRPGFKVATDALQKSYQETRDTIVLSDVATGKAALDSFKGWTYTAPAPATVQ